MTKDQIKEALLREYAGFQERVGKGFMTLSDANKEIEARSREAANSKGERHKWRWYMPPITLPVGENEEESE